jgi:hypothetical protein
MTGQVSDCRAVEQLPCFLFLYEIFGNSLHKESINEPYIIKNKTIVSNFDVCYNNMNYYGGVFKKTPCGINLAH